jgi:hypothetical protein
MPAPPITIGELSNVPAPGSPVASSWAQDATKRIVQRFPTVAALKAATGFVAAGAMGYVTGTRQLAQYDGTGWVVLSEPPQTMSADWVTTGSCPLWYPGGPAIFDFGPAWAPGAVNRPKVTANYNRSGGVCTFQATMNQGGNNFPFPPSPAGLCNLPFNQVGGAYQLLPGMYRNGTTGGLMMLFGFLGAGNSISVYLSATGAAPNDWLGAQSLAVNAGKPPSGGVNDTISFAWTYSMANGAGYL